MKLLMTYFPSCKFVVNSLSCGDPGPIHNGTIIGVPSFAVGAMVKFKCNECFDRKGPSSILCSIWGHWSGNVPKCIPRMCPEIRLENNTFLAAQPFGYEYRFQCNSPAILIGRPLLRCSCYGRWSSRAPFCQVPTTTPPVQLATTKRTRSGYCKQPEELVNGMMFPVKYGIGEGFQPGDRVYYMCTERYRMIATNFRECNVNLEWSNVHPYCQRKSEKDTRMDTIAREFHIVEFCPERFPPIDGDVIGSNRVGEMLEFKCSNGYKLVGAEFIRCQFNGDWSNNTPTCEPACDHYVCGTGEKCELDIASRPVCVCQDESTCISTDMNTICASDGNTYASECFMRVEACRKKKNITKISDEPCKPAPMCHVERTRNCTKKASVYRYSLYTGQCEFSGHGTCHSSGFDGFQTRTECEDQCKDICKNRWDSGPCKQSDKPTIRWMFYINGCRPFLYYGCLGNTNNFESPAMCQRYCMRNQVVSN